MRFEIWLTCSILLFMASVAAILLAVWLAKNQHQRDPRWDNTYLCVICRQGEMVEIEQLTEYKSRYICTNCGAEEIVDYDKETF